MRKSKFSEKQIIEILKEIEDGAPVVETLRDKGVSKALLFEYQSGLPSTYSR